MGCILQLIRLQSLQMNPNMLQILQSVTDVIKCYPRDLLHNIGPQLLGIFLLSLIATSELIDFFVFFDVFAALEVSKGFLNFEDLDMGFCDFPYKKAVLLKLVQ